ncbi:prolyl oligopeptidase family serine peptidase [Chryseobacterium gotjawalense]|uniref:Prolyl oligopeptidase family serine peptidase n=1 Tax=Chryseobacterium gotjawalense TaxID=3042315 RepID=A0ABY8RCV5_9FLAO|nr:prolyl oligopeptidase family serine peptidase [Chryseobacterium sp. wdc7]WHF51793.1 prolyl oligopeptidase family serine peptidase [Chryseobacterium sp. wdc7]
MKATKIFFAGIFLMALVSLKAQPNAQDSAYLKKTLHYQNYFTSRIVAVSADLNYFVVNQRNDYGKNEFLLRDILKNTSQSLPLRNAYDFIDNRYLVASTQSEQVTFVDLKKGKHTTIEGNFFVHLSKFTKKVILTDRKNEALKVYSNDGKLLLHLNGILDTGFEDDHGLLLARSKDQCIVVDMANMQQKSIDISSILQMGISKESVYALVQKNDDIQLVEWAWKINKIKRNTLRISVPYEVSSRLGNALKVREGRYLVLNLHKNFDKKKGLADINYSNQPLQYPLALKQMAIYDLQSQKWSRFPTVKDEGFVADFISEKGDFVQYKYFNDYVDTLSNPKRNITLFSPYGIKVSETKNPYVYKINRVYDGSQEVMLFFEDEKWQIQDFLKNRTYDADLPKGLKWHTEIYGELSDQPITAALRTSVPGKYLITGEHDLFLLDLHSNASQQITFGSREGLQYQVVTDLGPEKREVINLEKDILVTFFNKKNYRSGLAYLKSKGKPVVITEGKFRINKVFQRNEDLLFSTEFYNQPTQIYKYSKRKLEEVGQAQKDNSEALTLKVKIFEYMSRGKKLEAALLYPKNYNPTEKYPMIVNVYENMAREALRYEIPSLENSAGFNNRHFVEQGYFVLLPQIDQEVGNLGQSLTKSMENVVELTLRKANINNEKVAVRGTSFGGYGATYLMGSSKLFRTAIAGVAPVDLARAALTIRKMDGMPDFDRTAQQQFVINANVFTDWKKYLENSPIYKLPNVTQPILLWGGKEDTNVAPEQPMSYFLGLKRLGKDGIFLRYPDEGHVLGNKENKTDLTLKSWQWLDYYLKDKAPADWMLPMLMKEAPE